MHFFFLQTKEERLTVVTLDFALGGVKEEVLIYYVKDERFETTVKTTVMCVSFYVGSEGIDLLGLVNIFKGN